MKNRREKREMERTDRCRENIDGENGREKERGTEQRSEENITRGLENGNHSAAFT